MCLYTLWTHAHGHVYALTQITRMKQIVPKLSLPVHSSVPHWKIITWPWIEAEWPPHIPRPPLPTLVSQSASRGKAGHWEWGRGDLGPSPDAEEADPPVWHQILHVVRDVDVILNTDLTQVDILYTRRHTHLINGVMESLQIRLRKL